MFSSRQELINFMQSDVGLTGTSLDALNYLATFTRGLNQPSISPDQTRPLQPGPYPVYNSGNSNGNNNAAGFEGYSQVSNPINPIFPAVQVTGTFMRNDGTVAVVGEPLVNKRFALNRLAWLTYLGPSANRNLGPIVNGQQQNLTVNPGPTSPNYDIWQLENVYGIPASYLAQGTPANIENYFGLVWQVDTPTFTPGFHDGEYKWFYSGHNAVYASSGSTNPVSVTGTSGSISRLIDITSFGSGARDADFFELLKAAVLAGSKAKGAMNTSILYPLLGEYGAVVHPYYYQTFELDSNLDLAIIQLGANIIDQFKVDGYSTRIVFNPNTQSTNLSPPHEIRGVENLPYLYRFNSGTLRLRRETPLFSTEPFQGQLQDPGVAIVMDIPTIWNPHDANAPLGTPGPTGPNVFPTLVSGTLTNFRLICDSADPDVLQAVDTNPTPNQNIANTYTLFFPTGGSTSKDAPPPLYGNSQYSSPTSPMVKLWTTGTLGSGQPMNPPLTATSGTMPLFPGNSMLMFKVPQSNFFREPTPLARANVPIGSDLGMAPPTAITQYNQIENSVGRLAWDNNGFLSDDSDPLNMPGYTNSNQAYVGICATPIPAAYSTGSGGTSMIWHVGFAGVGIDDGPGPYLTYRLQYADPNTAATAAGAYSGTPTYDAGGNGWITYDEKYTQFFTDFLGAATYTKNGNLSDQADGAVGGDWQSYADPRTSRFAAITGKDDNAPVETPGEGGESQEFVDPANGTMFTDRPDFNSGYPRSVNRQANLGPVYIVEFGFTKALGWIIGNADFHWGLEEQNSPFAVNSTTLDQDNGIRFQGDMDSTPAQGAMYYSDADGAVRGAMGTYQVGTSSAPANDAVGLPMATAYPAGYVQSTSGTYQAQSRPYILHRPFRSVAELGYVFAGSPWKNIDFFTPQSGDASLLDLFTINEPPATGADPNYLVAGTVNLNTRQAPVLEALLAGAYVDETGNTTFSPLSPAQANAILTNANGLISRTTSTQMGEGPLRNVSELVGRWNNQLLAISGTENAFAGPSGDLTNSYAAAFSAPTLETMQNVQRFRESFIRPLASVGNTRVWNLMIDLDSVVTRLTGMVKGGNHAILSR